MTMLDGQPTPLGKDILSDTRRPEEEVVFDDDDDDHNNINTNYDSDNLPP